MNDKDIVMNLQRMGLTRDESAIYVELLQEPQTHLQLSYATGVNRTKVYRIIDHLQRKSLVSKRVDDRGTFLVASDPSSLEVALIADEQKLKQRREALKNIVPALSRIQSSDMRDFVVRTYDSEAGLRQMCWHELSTKGELLSLGNGTIEQQASDKDWASEHRKKQVAAGYKTREIINRDYTTDELPELAAQELIQSRLYRYRTLPTSVLNMESQTVIYNDTVGIYHWKQAKKVGIEIISATYANTLRQIFEQYWEIAEKKT